LVERQFCKLDVVGSSPTVSNPSSPTHYSQQTKRYQHSALS